MRNGTVVCRGQAKYELEDMDVMHYQPMDDQHGEVFPSTTPSSICVCERRRGAGCVPATMDEVGTEWAKCGEIRAWMTQSLSNRIGGGPLSNRLK